MNESISFQRLWQLPFLVLSIMRKLHFVLSFFFLINKFKVYLIMQRDLGSFYFILSVSPVKSGNCRLGLLQQPHDGNEILPATLKHFLKSVFNCFWKENCHYLIHKTVCLVNIGACACTFHFMNKQEVVKYRQQPGFNEDTYSSTAWCIPSLDETFLKWTFWHRSFAI